MELGRNKRIIEKLHKTDLHQYRNLSMLFDMVLAVKNDDLELAKSECRHVKNLAAIGARKDLRFKDLYWKAVLFLAPYFFEDFLIYMEKDRPAEKRFYLPRRKVLKIIVDDLQDLADRKLYFLGISLPPRVGKSTLCIFFMAWLAGRNPENTSAMAGHSDTLTKGFYTELLSVINDNDTYNFYEIFPNCAKVSTSAKDETLDLTGKTRRYCTVTCRGVLATWTGAVDISNGGCLYADDLIEDLEESLNISRLDKKFDAYMGQLRDRMKDDSFELMVGTRWSVLDVLGRIKAKYEGNPRYRFRVIPALNEKDESNFQYDYGVGFSTEYYHRMRDDLDDGTWWAKYMGRPYVREGLLFPKESLRYYNGILPSSGADLIIGSCDVAWGGGDFVSAPVAYVYGKDVYIHDVAYNNGNKEVTKPLVAAVYMRNNINQAKIEANNGGDEYAEDVDAIMRENGCYANIISEKTSNKSSKMAKIIQYAPDIRKFYFLDDAKPGQNGDPADRKYRDEAYQNFMDDLTMMVMELKGNKHDDTGDSLRILCEALGTQSVEVILMDSPI